MRWLLRWFRGAYRSKASRTTSPAAATTRPTPEKRAEVDTSVFEMSEVWDYPAEQRDELVGTSGLALAVQEQLANFLAEHESVLPAFPSVAGQVFELLDNPEFEMTRLVGLIQRDSVMSTEVIRVANSALFGGTREVLSVRDAVVKVGAQQVANIAAAASARSLFDLEARAGHQEFAELWQDLWLHSMTCASSAFWVADELRLENQRYAYLAGMLHDIGKAFSLWGLSRMVIARVVPAPMPELTRMIIEQNHVEAGRLVAGSWQIPDVLKRTITDHHELSKDQDPLIPTIGILSSLNEMRRNPAYPTSFEAEVRRAVLLLDLAPPRLRSIVSRLRDGEKNARALTL
ncbi:MAG: HDOD domain-containing protein [Myxococcota bacterium]